MRFGKMWSWQNMVVRVGEVSSRGWGMLQVLRLDGGWIFVILTKIQIGLLVHLKRRLVVETKQNSGLRFGWETNRFEIDSLDYMESQIRRKAQLLVWEDGLIFGGSGILSGGGNSLNGSSP
ncbi:hypothetical protein QL285_050990 [Trifolium repens]|nr:hypothetical protein QL285_050990 [Trifolium repens]